MRPWVIWLNWPERVYRSIPLDVPTSMSPERSSARQVTWLSDRDSGLAGSCRYESTVLRLLLMQNRPSSVPTQR